MVANNQKVETTLKRIEGGKSTKRKKYAIAKAIFSTIFLIAILYFAIASVVFQINNPIANRFQIYSNLSAVFNFETLPKFQTKP